MAYATFVITGTTPSASGPAAVVGSPVVFSNFIDAPEGFDCNADLIGATGGPLNLYLQTSPDKGTNWYDYAAFAQLAASAAALNVRFGCTRETGNAGNIVTVGKNLVANTGLALAAGTVVGGPFGDRMRLVAIPGALTSAGATITIRLSVSGTNAIFFPQT